MKAKRVRSIEFLVTRLYLVVVERIRVRGNAMTTDAVDAKEGSEPKVVWRLYIAEQNTNGPG